MKLTVIAATGGIGRQLLIQAVAAGHDVTAVARNPGQLQSAHVHLVAADLATAGSHQLQPAVDGADAVVSALGPRSKADAGVAWRGTEAIVQAMSAAGVRRILVVSAAPVGTVASPGRPDPPRHDPPRHDPGDGFVMRNLAYPVLRTAFREIYADLARMEDVLRESGLDWTVVRPVRLTGKPVTGMYRTSFGQNVRHGLFISRADVAHYMLHAIDEPETFRQTVGIAN
jgi:putative NADH-flavin reductase